MSLVAGIQDGSTRPKGRAGDDRRGSGLWAGAAGWGWQWTWAVLWPVLDTWDQAL